MGVEMRVYYRYLCLWFVLLLTSCSTGYHQLTQSPVTIDNCEVGCPTGGSVQTLVRESYTLNNNSDSKFANWVAYKITKASQASGRPRDWKQDPALPATDTLPPDAYKNANVLLGVDRGHQAPLAGLGGASDWQSLNYLSNITPQKSDLNQGPWVRLEAKERELANRSDVTAVYSVTGPLFERHIATLPADPSVEIPSAYWKIIFIGVSPDKGQYAAFLMDQTTPKSANFCDYQVTVDLIESKTHPKLTIWSSLPANVSALIKATKGTLANEMGCSVSTSI